MTSPAMTIFCFPLILSSILVLSGRGGGWLELRFPSGGRILHLYTKLLDWAPQIFFRSLGVACSLYIDDRLNGELFALKGFWSRPLLQRTPEYSYQTAEAALYIVCLVLVNLGYFLGLPKCVLVRVTSIGYLGMIVDSIAQAFRIPEDKKIKFSQLREQILSCGSTISLESLQRLMGKCNSFSLAFLASSTNEQLEMVISTITLLSTIYKRTTESTGTLPSALPTVKITINDSLWKAGLLT